MTIASKKWWLLNTAVFLCALVGLNSLIEDGPAAYRLEPESPLISVNKRLQSETGGGRVVLALVESEETLLSEQGLGRIDAVYKVMAANAGLERIQAVHVVPVLQSVDGVVVASTPLQPAPADEDSWRDASRLVLGDPLLKGQLISADGHAALVVGWLRSADEAALLSLQAQTALQNEDFRQGPDGQAVSAQINAARMAVVLGEAGGSAAHEVARHLTDLAEQGGPAADDIARWSAYSQALIADPEEAVLQSLHGSLAELSGPSASVRLFSPRLVETAFGDAFRQSVAVLLAALLLTVGWFVSRKMGLLAGALAAGLCGVGFLNTLGAAGWLGITLHPLTAFAAMSAALWVAVLLLLRPTTALSRLMCGAALGAPVLLGLPGGPGLSDLRVTAASGLLVALMLSEAWAALPLKEKQRPEGPSSLFVALSGRSVPLAWLVVLVGSAAMLLARPFGIDPGGMVAPQDEVGKTASLIDEHFGAASGAFLVLDGVEPGAVGQPEALQTLAATQARLSKHPAVRSVVSWSDFIARIHQTVSDSAPGELPDNASLVEQYLLLFNQPERTRMFVAVDLSLASGAVRTNRRGGAELATIASMLPAGVGTPALAGESVAMAVAVRRQAIGLLGGLLLAALLFTAVLLRMRSDGNDGGLVGGSLAVPASAAMFALAGGCYVAGALGVFGVLGACWVLGVLGSAIWLHARGDTKSTYDVFQLLALIALPLSLSLALPLRGMGVAVLSATLLATFLFVPDADREQAEQGP